MLLEMAFGFHVIFLFLLLLILLLPFTLAKSDMPNNHILNRLTI